MRGKLVSKLFSILVLLSLLVTMPLLSACGGDSETTTTTTSPTGTTTTVEAKAEFEVVKAAVADYLTDMVPHVMASDLHMMIVEGDAPYIVSIRSADNHAAGHIPGAINISFGELNTLPKDEEIWLYCDSGQVASFAAVVLGMSGYDDVTNLKHGISGWTSDPSIATLQFDPEKHQSDFQTETTANEGGSFDYPELENTTSTDANAIIAAAVATISSKFILATDLNMKIAEGEDMTILDIRSADYYAAGHIPGAINFGKSSLIDNLEKLDPDAPVYVYCDTGHWAAEVTALLQVLGYDAYSLKFGICSWSPDEAINNGLCYDAASVPGYDTE
ncbi:MAG: rhodanese-like domain-containing protein [Dehalococcoidia bacterium]|jgi:rhodanese-related sulfurtransferase